MSFSQIKKSLTITCSKLIENWSKTQEWTSSMIRVEIILMFFSIDFLNDKKEKL